MDLSGILHIDTGRLQLRALTPEVYQTIMTGWEDAAIMDLLGLATDEVLAAEKQKFRQGMATWNRSFVFFQILEKSSGRIIGSCGYHTWYLQHARAELGYSLYRDEDKGKGFMKEALSPVIHYGFEVMRLH